MSVLATFVVAFVWMNLLGAMNINIDRHYIRRLEWQADRMFMYVLLTALDVGLVWVALPASYRLLLRLWGE